MVGAARVDAPGELAGGMVEVVVEEEVGGVLMTSTTGH